MSELNEVRKRRNYSKGGKQTVVKRGTPAERRKWKMASRKRRKTAAFKQYQRRQKTDPAAKRRERVKARFEGAGNSNPYLEAVMRQHNLAANLAESFSPLVESGDLHESLTEALDRMSSQLLELAEGIAEGDYTIEEACSMCAQAAKNLAPAIDMYHDLAEGDEYDDEEDDEDWDEDEDEEWDDEDDDDDDD